MTIQSKHMAGERFATQLQEREGLLNRCCIDDDGIRRDLWTREKKVYVEGTMDGVVLHISEIGPNRALIPSQSNSCSRFVF